MKFEDKLKARSREDVWNEYCGFLDLSMDEFVQIQNRLMEEQIALWSRSPLGKKILKGIRTLKNVTNIIIGQRIVSVCEADNIIILDDGEIVASGNHKSLYKESNIYKELCDTQLGGEDYGNNA